MSLSPSEQAERYLAKCPHAISGQGGHNTAYSVVVAIAHGFALDEHDAYRLLSGWNAGCQPPWSDVELRHKIQDAIKKPHDKPRGHKLSSRTNYKASSSSAPPKAAKDFKAVKYDIVADDFLPEPITDGTREIIRTLFHEGEGIRVAPAKLNEEGKEVPDSGGFCLDREAWLKRLDKVSGDPNRIFCSSDRTGIYIAMNPYKVGATKDDDVTDFRHALVEFDEGLTPEEQLNLYQKMNLPCAAIIFSGGKSIHAWVKVEAKNRTEYDERVRIIYGHFSACGFRLDEKNKNPGRLSRLPNCMRFDRRQELLFLNCGAETFAKWQEEVHGDDLGEIYDVDDLGQIDPEDKTDVLLGDDWLNKGGSCLLSGQSGIGKSSLAMQWAILWAMGQPAMGIVPSRPLKSVIVCAENDPRDNRGMMFGILSRLGIDKDFTPAEYALVKKNVKIRENFTASADRFIDIARRMADKDKPDLMWLDPTAAFVGDDLSKQTVIASFFRNGLHPIAKARGFAWFIINHFTKPPSDNTARKGWTASDHQYRGAGSYDLAGWARAGITLAEVTDGVFQLRFAKRGRKSGACHPSGEPSALLWLRHSQKEVFWEQADPPTEADHDDAKPQKAEKGIAEMLALVPVAGEILKAHLLESARAAGFTTRRAADVLSLSLSKGRNGEPPSLVIRKEKRPGTNPAQMVSRNKENP